MVTLRTPDEREPAGEVARGFYRYTSSRLRVYDVEGALLGATDRRPGDNVEAAARKILKEKCGGSSFYDRINYSDSSY